MPAWLKPPVAGSLGFGGKLVQLTNAKANLRPGPDQHAAATAHVDVKQVRADGIETRHQPNSVLHAAQPLDRLSHLIIECQGHTLPCCACMLPSTLSNIWCRQNLEAGMSCGNSGCRRGVTDSTWKHRVAGDHGAAPGGGQRGV